MTNGQNYVNEFVVYRIDFKLQDSIDIECKIGIVFSQFDESINDYVIQMSQDYFEDNKFIIENQTYEQEHHKQEVQFDILDQRIMSQNTQLLVNENQQKLLYFSLYNAVGQENSINIDQNHNVNNNFYIKLQIVQANTNYVIYQSQKIQLPQVQLNDKFKIKVSQNNNNSVFSSSDNGDILLESNNQQQILRIKVDILQQSYRIKFLFQKNIVDIKYVDNQYSTNSQITIQDIQQYKSNETIKSRTNNEIYYENCTLLDFYLKNTENQLYDRKDIVQLQFDFDLYIGELKNSNIIIQQYDKKNIKIAKKQIRLEAKTQQTEKVKSILRNDDQQKTVIELEIPIEILDNSVIQNSFSEKQYVFDTENCDFKIKKINNQQQLIEESQYQITKIDENLFIFDLQQQQNFNIQKNDVVHLIYNNCFILNKTHGYANKDYLNFDFIHNSNISFSFAQPIYLNFVKWNQLTYNLYPEQFNSVSILEIFLQTSYEIQQNSYIIIKTLGQNTIQQNHEKQKFDESIQLVCQVTINQLIQTNFPCEIQDNDIKVKMIQNIDKNQNLEIYIANFKIHNQNIQIDVIYEENYSQIIKGSLLTQLKQESQIDNMFLSPQQPELLYTVSEIYNDQQFYVTFQLYIDQDIDTQTQILLNLGNNTQYIKQPIECFINEIQRFCVGFPNYNKILIKINDSQDHYIYQIDQNIIKIGPLNHPSYQKKLSEEVTINILQQNSIIKQYVQPPFLQSTPFQKFQKLEFLISNQQQGFPYAEYQIELQSYIDINFNDTIKVIFPFQYNFSRQKNEIEVETNIQEQNQFKTRYNLNEIYLTVLKQIKKDDILIIKIKNILNPLETNNMNDFQIIHQNENNDIATIQQHAFDLQLVDKFETQSINLKKLLFVPQNGLLQTDVNIELSLDQPLPQGSEIILNFPESYQNLPAQPSCYLSGSMNYFRSCQVNQNQFIIITQENYVSGNLEIVLKDLFNPKEDVIKDFAIEIKYNNVLLNRIEEKLNIEITNNQQELLIQNFEIQKNNDGQFGDYIFIFQDLDLINNNQIILKFQRSFFSELLEFEEIIYQFDQKMFWHQIHVNTIIINFNGQKIYESFKLVIKNLIVPEKIKNQNSSIIEIGIKNNQQNYFSQYNQNSAVIYPQDSPKLIKLLDIKQENNYSGYFNNIQIQFMLYNKVPSHRGQIVLQLSEEFYISQIIDVKIQLYKILESEFGTQFELMENNLYEIKQQDILIRNNDESFFGKYELKISNIVNPEIQNTYFSIGIYTYNNYYHQIIASCHENIDQQKLQYQEKGRPITINDDKDIIIEKGTQSNDILVQTDFPFQLNLKLKAILIQGISIVPFFINIEKGTKQSQFRIQVSQDLQIDQYQIEWQKMKDLNPQIYQPIKRTNIIITSNKNNIVEFEENDQIPLNGTSLSTAVILKNSPDVSIELKLVQRQDYNNIKLDRNFFQFTTGQQEHLFKIDCLSKDQDLINRQLEFDIILQGENKDVYKLSKQVLVLNIIEEDNIKPEILEFEIISLSQSSADLQITVSEISDLFFMIALIGTETPSTEVLKNQGPQIFSESQSQFGLKRFRNNLTQKVPIENLTASREYVFYAILIDRGNNVSEEIFQTTFYTYSAYKNVLLQIPISQQRLNSSQKYLQRQQIAFSLALSLNSIQEDYLNYYSQDNFTQNYIILPQIINKKYTHPLDLLNTIKLQDIKFFNEQNYSYKELDPVQTEFENKPKIVSIKKNTITLEVSLKNKGYVFAVAIPLEQKQDRDPRPFQIYNGVDSNNKKYNSSFVAIKQENQIYNLNFFDLQEETIYTIFLVPAAGTQQNPNIMGQQSVVEIEQKITYQQIQSQNSFVLAKKIILFYLIVAFYQLIQII